MSGRDRGLVVRTLRFAPGLELACLVPVLLVTTGLLEGSMLRVVASLSVLCVAGSCAWAHLQVRRVAEWFATVAGGPTSTSMPRVASVALPPAQRLRPEAATTEPFRATFVGRSK